MKLNVRFVRICYFLNVTVLWLGVRPKADKRIHNVCRTEQVKCLNRYKLLVTSTVLGFFFSVVFCPVPFVHCDLLAVTFTLIYLHWDGFVFCLSFKCE